MSYFAPYFSMLLLLVLVGLVIAVLVYVVKIHNRPEQNQNNPINPTLAKILELLRQKQMGYTPAAPSGGTAEKPQKPVEIDCGSGHWRCLENRAGTHVSSIGEDGKVLDTFQVASQPVQEVLWALCQL